MQAPRRDAVAVARWAGIAAVVIGLVYLMVSIWDRDALARWMSDAPAVPFFVAMAVLPVVGVPQSPFTVIAGATFGIWVALAGSIAAIAVNLCLGYVIAQTKLRPRIEALFRRFDYKVPDFAAGGRAAWRFAVAVKLTPALPMVAKIYIPAVTSVPFNIYFAVSLVIGTAFAAAWIVLGDSLLAHDVDHATLAAIAIVVLAVVAVIWWRKRGDDAAAAAA
jgi:uncharacterized membrane protein YdjX (TVP38/TMEM64 family)